MKTITRRTFIKGGVAAGAAAVCGGVIRPIDPAPVRAAAPVDLAIVEGKPPFDAANAAVEALGGIGRFVPRGATVALLINAPFRNPGTHVNPDVALAVVKLCRDAGAKAIISLKDAHGGYWEAADHFGDLGALAGGIGDGGRHLDRKVPGKALKEARIVEGLFSADVFINLSVVKHHEGTRFSSALKNMMGALPHSTCRYFHMGTGKSGWYGDLDHMNQCIADINKVRKPDLVLVDATSFITTNGPFGPGKLSSPGQVIAGTDPVLVDAHGCTLLGLDPKEVGMIVRAAADGVGKMDVEAAHVRRIAG